MDLISNINDTLPALDQLRWILKTPDEIKNASNGMASVANSLKRLSIFLAQRVEEIDQQSDMQERASSEKKPKYVDEIDSPVVQSPDSKDTILDDINSGKTISQT
jgi:hypothetical protein